MRTRRRTYTAVTPPSLLPNAQALPVSGTKRRQLQSCTAKAKGNRRPEKKKKKCIIEGLWDLKLPSDLLEEILSRLGLKANIHASLVCKAWCEAAVSVRKLKPRPWAFHPIDDKSSPTPTASPYILVDPSRRSQSQTYKVDLSLMKDVISCSKDGWLLVRSFEHNCPLFINPFTHKHFYLPKAPFLYQGYCLAFSAAPTSSNCVVISCTRLYTTEGALIFSWRPGESEWTTHRFHGKAQDKSRWDKCVFSNGLFYCLSICGLLSVFDPCEVTWNILPVKPLPFFLPGEFPEGSRTPVFITEHQGDIFVIYTHRNKSYRTRVFKLNLKENVWEEKRDLGGLTVFLSFPSSFIRVGLSAEERNRIYPLVTDIYGKVRCRRYYSIGDEKSSHPPERPCVSSCVAWVEPPHNIA